MKPQKKISAKNRAKAGVRKKKQPATRQQTWIACGFDTSMSSLAGAAVGYDRTLRKLKGPVFTMLRWDTNYNYLERLRDASNGYKLVLDLIVQLNMTPEADEIFIAQEEPFPAHGSFMQRGQSGHLKQQAEISGAFLGGLMRYGYHQLWQISNQHWRQIIARDFGITIHHSKWRDPELAAIYNCKPADSGKFRAKQWATNGLGFDSEGKFSGSADIPIWPDIINSKHGKIPRPETSKAKAIQPDDRYDALAICQWMVEELERGLT